MKLLKRNFHLKITDSTSAYLLRRRFVLRNFSNVYADFQTNGKGRENRVWQSNKKQNLLFSVLITDNVLLDNFPSLSVATATSVINLLQKLGIDNLQFKWPNDVYVSGKKICGILLESISEQNTLKYIAVGIGLNVNQQVFSGEFLHKPTSLFIETGKSFSIKKIKSLLLKELKITYNKIKLNNKDYLNTARKLNYLKGKTVNAEIDGIVNSVLVLDINDDNSLKVRCNDKEYNLNYGEITFHVN